MIPVSQRKGVGKRGGWGVAIASRKPGEGLTEKLGEVRGQAVKLPGERP